MKRKIVRIFSVIIFTFIMLIIFKNEVNASEITGLSCKLIKDGKEYDCEHSSSDGIFYVKEEVYVGGEAILHISKTVPGLKENYICENTSSEVSAIFYNKQINTDGFNLAEFNVAVKFNESERDMYALTISIKNGEKEEGQVNIVFDNVSNKFKDAEKVTKESFGTSTYNEVYLRNYTATEMAKYIINRSYSSYTNQDSNAHKITLGDAQFSYAGKINWENIDSGMGKKTTIKDLKLKCIKDSNNSLWTKDEEWSFSYIFYYIPELNKLMFCYSSSIVKSVAGDDYTDFPSSVDKITERENKFESGIKNLVNSLQGEDREVYENFDDVLENVGNYVPTTEDAPDEVYSKAGLILGIISNIGIIMSVLMPAILGIKYMLGSVEDKSEYKKDMIPYLVGSVLLFGICGIVKILQAIGENINNI